MTMIKTLLLSLLVASVVACSHSYSVGNDFSEDKISQITEGQTTTSGLISLFGEPYSKVMISETHEKWLYFLASGQTKEQKSDALLEDMTTPAEPKHKMLSVLVSGDVVTSYGYVEGIL
ncbi:hypothetical protein K0504_01325 [Neiella marina]|uniref:Lipoprotein SmpA/OmlA domain-containing protein n=1 Tax=Neiella holothuriorum TaxID=2870530 RepID=A0ABS7EBF8_9GAMM|nr:hypothetical protein [Neiella holothuriorum]MBW8189662.1 hypothetical protein [Neiella holothuriorum]